MVDVVLVELEDVVFETRAQRHASLRDALAAHGIEPELDAEAVSEMVPRASIVAALAGTAAGGDDVLVDLLTLRAERSFTARLAMGGVTIRAGSRTFIEEAASAARIGAVTRASRADADVMLRLSGLESAFSVAVCGDDVLDPKPSSEGYHLALDRLRRQRPVARGAVIALESTAAGIRAARGAVLRCIATGAVPAHVAMDADAFVETLEGQTVAMLDQLSKPGQERVQ